MTDLQLFTKISSLADEQKKQVELFLDSLQAKGKRLAQDSGKLRLLGQLKGKVVIKDNFDEPLDDFKDYM